MNTKLQRYTIRSMNRITLRDRLHRWIYIFNHSLDFPKDHWYLCWLRNLHKPGTSIGCSIFTSTSHFRWFFVCWHCGKVGSYYYHQRTRYVNEEQNWTICCSDCAVINDEYWDDQWKEYYGGLL